MYRGWHSECIHPELCTRDEVSKWFDIGLAAKARNLIIVKFQHDNHCRPLYVTAQNDPHFIQKAYEFNHKCVVFEVYNLAMDKEKQIHSNERCWNYE
jgi:hypothetical protein